MSAPPSYKSSQSYNPRPGSQRGSSNTSRSNRGNSGPPDPDNLQPFPKHPNPCNRPRSECPNHAKNYRKMLESLHYREVNGPAELEYIYSNERGRDTWADAVKADLENMGVWRGLLEHFGALQGPGLLKEEEGYGGGSSHAYGSNNYGGFSGGGGGGYGSDYGSSHGHSSMSSRATVLPRRRGWRDY